MEDKILELTDILEQEMFLYEESLNTTSREKDAMQRYSLEGMLDCQKSRMSLNLRISELENIRKGITDEIFFASISNKVANNSKLPVLFVKFA